MANAPKVLLVVPANNTTMEPELRALYPEASDILVARVKRPPTMLTVESIPAYGRATIEAVAPFIAAKADLVVYGCTAAGFLAGPDGNARMVDALHRATGAPVVSTAEAMIEALRASNVSRTAVVTPYLKAVNDGLEGYLQTSGITVERLDSFLCETTDALGRITAEEVEAKALATMTPATPALFIACSQLPTLAIIEPLRRRLGVPVWSSIQATAWSGARVLEARGFDMSLLAARAQAA
jgi:maleate cis-trans isomerase